ncbi:MAG: DNA-directed RNA polymerase subunit D [Desulfurococcales archaeon]|nr:DNA-directed RNA polymerase subunit D [Desulfurococcales archaeon]
MSGDGRRVEVLSLDSRRITVYMEGFDLALANAIRRLSLSDVPTMAVDFAYFYDNNTSIYDEIIAHRLGLIVLSSDDALYKYKSPEECKGREPPDPQCFVEIILQEEVSLDESQGKYVKASDLVISDPLVKPVYPETPIAYLAPGQRIHVVAYARLGRGREHSKWSPASTSILQYTPVVDILASDVSDECLKCLDAYPEVVEAVKKGEKRVEYRRNINTSGLLYCSETKCEGQVRLWYDKNRLLLTVESTGAMRPERIILEASKALEARAINIEKALEKTRGVTV